MSRTSYLEPLRRSNRNQRRLQDRVLATQVPAPFFYAADIAAVNRYFAAIAEPQNVPSELPYRISGTCYVCNLEVDFEFEGPADGGEVNWRETLSCPRCKMINRWRGCLHVFDTICQPDVDDRIYLTETLSRVYENLAGRFPHLSSSEFLPHADFGELILRNEVLIRNEDVTNLGFDDACLDSILCFDVLEHVYDYKAALREFHRVLDTAGQLVLSVPFSFETDTIVRATLDDQGHVNHLLEPCYHGDPLSEQGVLSYHDFGMSLLDDMRAAGFEECFVICYQSKEWGYLDRNVVFIARKLKSSLTKTDLARSVWQNTRYQLLLEAEEIAEHSRIAAQYPVRFARRVLNRLYARPAQKSHYGETLIAADHESRQLPEIYHYWSNRYLVPEMNRLGFSNQEDFYFQHAKRFIQESQHRRVNILSIGSWDCSFEIRIVRRLLQWQLNDFTIECLEVNPEQLNAGRAAVEAAGLGEYFRFTRDDPNLWKPYRKYGLVLSNQSLHDVWNLAGLIETVRRALRSDGLFIISDMIGRNGRMFWPEAVQAMKPFWQELPENYRYNRIMQRQEEVFINEDMTTLGFGSLHSQEILPLLLKRFRFSNFFPYGNIIFIFIDRYFGHNFNAEAVWDKDFIDRVHARDEAGILSGELKPTSMMAVLTKRKTDIVLRHPVLTPEHCRRGFAIDSGDVPRENTNA